MKMPARKVAWLLPLLLAGCTHNTTQVQPLAPPIVDAPLPTPSTAPKDLPPPVVSVPAQPAPADTTPAAQTQEPPPQPPKRKKPAPAPPTQQASNDNSGVSAIGQLSSGAPSDLRQQTSELIASTERGLNGINRTLSDQEQKTASQVREFLRQAREALASSDVDGAHTLAKKAQVLLSELTQ